MDEFDLMYVLTDATRRLASNWLADHRLPGRRLASNWLADHRLTSRISALQKNG